MVEGPKVNAATSDKANNPFRFLANLVLLGSLEI
jgi:hypothetical protein